MSKCSGRHREAVVGRQCHRESHPGEDVSRRGQILTRRRQGDKHGASSSLPLFPPAASRGCRLHGRINPSKDLHLSSLNSRASLLQHTHHHAQKSHIPPHDHRSHPTVVTSKSAHFKCVTIFKIPHRTPSSSLSFPAPLVNQTTVKVNVEITTGRSLHPPITTRKILNDHGTATGYTCTHPHSTLTPRFTHPRSKGSKSNSKHLGLVGTLS